MRNRTLLGVSLLGACALGVSAFSGALASSPSPLHDKIQPGAGNVTFQGRVTVNNVLRVQKNASVYGHAYAHNDLQVWRGLLVHNGGIRADALDVSGPIQVQSANVTGGLQAGMISGTSLSISGAASIGGTLTASGKISGNGLDAGTGGLTTTGNISASNVSAASINDSGALNANSISTSGALSAGPTSLSSLTVTGNVNFSGATVTGLNLSGLNANGATLPSLTVGSSSGSAAPLTISSNGHTAQLGVNSAGALSLGDLNTSGNVTVAGPSGVATALVQGIPASGSSNPGPLSLQGSTILLAGDTTIANGGDLRLGASGSSASHIIAAGNGDIAGTVSIHLSSGQTTSTESTKSVTFAQPYTSVPTVTLTPLADPDPGSSYAPKVWVTLTQGSGNYVGFTVHYFPSATADAAHDIPFGYHVIG